MPNNDIDKLKKLSIQARADEQAQSATAIWYFNRYDNTLIAPWWSEQRDIDLRKFWMLEGNDILQGAISSLVKKFKAMNWLLEGPQTRVKERQNVLITADFGRGWAELIGKTLTDYLSQDKGGFWELIGEGNPEGPMSGLPLGIAHLDAQYCQLTGDIVYPVLFHSTKTGKVHKLHSTRVAHFVDMPSPNEDMNGIGFCGVSRVIASSQVLLKLAQYKNEKLSDLPQAGLLLLNNITQQKWDDVTATFEKSRRKLGQELWFNIITLLGYDPAQPITAQFLSFADLPETFDELQSTNIYINILALSFGVDPREFWPITEGRLGSSAETTIQHQKAKGKLVGEVTSMLERAINWLVMPSNTEFSFDFQDDEEDKLKAEVNDKRVETIMRMYQGDAVNPPPVTALEIRQMLADNTDYFLEEFLEIDITDDTELTDTEREDKAYKGPTICLDRFGRKRRRSIIHKKPDNILELVEQNYKRGLIDVETLVNYRLGMAADEELTDEKGNYPMIPQQTIIPPATGTKVMVSQPAININVPELPPLPPIEINIPEQPAPVVNVTVPDIHITIPEQKPSDVVVNVPKQEPPNVTLELPMIEEEIIEIERDEQGSMKRARKIRKRDA